MHVQLVLLLDGTKTGSRVGRMRNSIRELAFEVHGSRRIPARPLRRDDVRRAVYMPPPGGVPAEINRKGAQTTTLDA